MTEENKKNETIENENVTPENEVVTENEKDNSAPNTEEAKSAIDVNLSEEVAKWQDRYARLSAEFDNYRKRTLKEKMDLVSSASEDVIKSVLTILDDLDRAVEANSKSEDVEVVRKGTELIHKKLGDLLRSKGVQEIDAMGKELDTDLHEAIAKFPVEEEEKKERIIDVVERGYKLKDKVIRYSKVVVGE